MNPSDRRTGRPKRSLSQNFLVDPNIRRKIVEQIHIEPGDTVVEIGPGRGALTEGLLRRAERLVVVELDRDLAADWIERARAVPNLEAIHSDILDVHLSKVADPGTTVVVGNIPYNITTPILFHLLRRPRPRDIVLMMQKEVADRLQAAPGTKSYGALSVGVQLVSAVEPLLRVPRSVFRPRPKVDSVVVRIVPTRPPGRSQEEEVRVRSLTRAAFQWRRKQIGTILRRHPDLALGDAEADRALAALGIDPKRRPETLSVDEFVALSEAVRSAA